MAILSITAECRRNLARPGKVCQMAADMFTVPVDTLYIVEGPPERWWAGVRRHLIESEDTNMPVIARLVTSEVELKTKASKKTFRRLLIVTRTLDITRGRLRIDGVCDDSIVSGIYNLRRRSGSISPVYVYR